MKSKTTASSLLTLGLLATVFVARAAADVHPNAESGVAIDRAFQVGDIDNINLFNGNLTLTIPTGISYPVGGSLSYQLTLVHNSNPWEIAQRVDPNTGQTYTFTVPSSCSTAGVGWRVTLGALKTGYQNTPGVCVSFDDQVAPDRAIYEAPDGSQHIFYPTLHPSDPDDSGDTDLLHQNVLYTRDGSYLRLRKVPPDAEIDFPDGTIHHFQSDGRLTDIHDRFGNQMSVNYVPTSCGGASSCWQITDTQGRSHWIYFRSDLSPYPATVDRVVLAAFGAGATATYQFNYTHPTIGRGCPNSDPMAGDLAVPLLASVTQPDGSSFAVPGYVTDLAGPAGCINGAAAVTALTLPTLGSIEWGYMHYAFPSEAGNPRRAGNWGIGSRSTKDANGAVVGQWTYATALTQEPFGAHPQELVNTVTDPLGNRMVRYFSLAAGGGFGYGPGANAFDYARQYTPKVTYPGDSTLFLSSQVFDASNVLRRSEYAQYVRDQIDTGAQSLIDQNNNNGRVLRSRTVYDDGTLADLTNSDFDGLGHFRTQQTGGTFSGNNVRTHYTNFNPAQGTYAVTQASNTVGAYSPLTSASPWVINTSGFEWNAENSVTEFRSFCYEGNGFLARRRVHNANGSGQGANDLVQVFGHNPSGDLTSEQYYGGDNQPVATGNLCAISLPTPEYQINHTYAAGTRATSQYAGVSFKSLDRDIDGNTGLPVRSRDTSGVQTSFTYDTLGRLTYAKPPQGAWTNYTYNRATSPSNLASIVVDRQQNGSPTVSLAQQRYFFDGLGRLIREERKMPDGTFSQRTTAYNALGWKTAVSEQGTPAALTRYSNYDPFGRPGTIQPPDGSGHNVTLSYSGVQSVSRQVKVGTSWNGTSVVESSPTTIESYDRQGRLISVTEPSGASGATVITSYGYDVGNRLSSVSTGSAGTTQTRTFSYDLRGFLRFENHPEKDANSFGQGHDVDYSSYDSRGHAHRSVDGGNDLSFSYDAAERPRTTYVTGGALPCTSNSPTCVKDLTYDSAGGGKLYQASRWNHILLGGAPHVSKLTHTYTYKGVDGRVSQRTLQHTFDGLTDPSKEAFVQSFTYTQLGDLDTETYPNCTAGFTSCAGSTARAVPMTYANGFLTAVVGYTIPVPNSTWGITYYPNGMTAQVEHSNGVLTTYANDPNGMARPSSITSALGQTTLWATGTYQYDGVGDVKQIGNGYFLYDGVSRLVNSAIVTQAVNGPVSLTQAYTFDAFGNIQTITGRSTPTNSATNRLTGGSYDASGNLGTWNGATYDYDELNQLKHYLNGAEEWLYIYDAESERTWSFKVGAAPRFDRWTLRGLDGKVRRDYEVTGYGWNNWSASNAWEDYIYRNGQLLAGYFSSGGRRHMDVDHLGTVRLVTNQAGALTGYHVYYPFGEEATAFNQDDERMKFTGHERDLANLAGAGDDLDYMHARHYGPLTGRFLSADLAGGRPNSPQSWNRYAYTRGNPLKRVDPDGTCDAPAGLQEGQVGICFQSFIAAPHIGGIGLGDDRTFAANDPSATFRTSFKMIIDPKTGKVLGKPEVTAGHSDVLIRGLGLKGSSSAGLSSSRTTAGKTLYSVLISGLNGLSALNTFGTIGFRADFTVDSSGKAEAQPTSVTKGYPSIEGFAYTMVQGELVVQILFRFPEQDPSKLDAPMNQPLTSPPPK